jgi:hypothetical protein
MEMWRKEQVTTGNEILYDSDKAAAWFEYKNRTSGQRYQVSDPSRIPSESDSTPQFDLVNLID